MPKRRKESLSSALAGDAVGFASALHSPGLTVIKTDSAKTMYSGSEKQ